EKLKNNRFDLDAILLRAESAEQLNLFGQAISDYERYLTTSTDIEAKSRVEDKLNAVRQKQTEIVDVEPTSYERLNKLIDEYLQALVKGDSKRAQNRLETAKAIATLMLEDTGERVGVDSVEYYSKVSFANAQELLKARELREEVSKVVAIDKFQESIDKLEKAKRIFTEQNAIADVQTTVFLLAKFLPRVNRVSDAEKEVGTWLTVAEERGYLFDKAKLLYQQSQINFYQGAEQVAVDKSLESLEICEKLGVEKFTLYPRLLAAQVYGSLDESDLAFAAGTEGLRISLKYKNSAFMSQFLQICGYVSAQMNLLNLSEIYLRQTVRICETEGFHGYTAVSRSILGSLLAEKGEFEEAKKLLQKAKMEDVPKTSDLIARKQQLLRINGFEGKVYGLNKEFDKAEIAYKEAIKLIKDIGYEKVFNFYRYKHSLGEALYEQRKKPEALKELLEAKSLYRRARERARTQNKNKILDVNFSKRDINETIRLVQR
ncbi:MAG: hypothetical protein JNN15_12915, partial [Blastocatellia bacterium]|nr:hypothetical protein [Blastocatellia bacterium]